MNNITFILGTRPEIIKLYPLIRLAETCSLNYKLIHTNQHYDKNMDRDFFEELQIPLPEYNLQIKSGSQSYQIGRMIEKLEDVLQSINPRIVVVQGDTNTVLAGALSASKLNIQVAHVEAGLRSYDRTMPEEINRIVTDHISSYLFAPTMRQKTILQRENISHNVYVTGNTIADAIHIITDSNNDYLKLFDELKIKKDNYFLLTCHRPSNVDNLNNINCILSSINELSSRENKPCIYPVHPRVVARHQKKFKDYPHIQFISPVGYSDLLSLVKHSNMVFTDSGGIQEEACILHKKCLILRLNTERPETLEVGGARLLKSISSSEILNSYTDLKSTSIDWYNPFGDGHAAEMIMDVLCQ